MTRGPRPRGIQRPEDLSRSPISLVAQFRVRIRKGVVDLALGMVLVEGHGVVHGAGDFPEDVPLGEREPGSLVVAG